MKQALRTLSLLLLVGMIFALAACSGETTTTVPPTGGTTTTVAATGGTTATVPATAGASTSTETVSAVPRGGHIVTYFAEFYNEYDPAVYTNRNFVSFFYDMLWNIDLALDQKVFNYTSTYLSSDYLTGQIAESWEIAPDFASMTVKLRKDVKFQDKTTVGMDAKYNVYGARPLVAADVKWSYDRLLGLDGATKVAPNETNWPANLSMLKSVEVVDPSTVKFNFNTNYQLAVGDFMCARVNIAGPEWDTLTEAQKADWHYATGSGPFIMTDYVPDNSMTFTANPGYWQKDAEGNKLPYVDTVTLAYLPDKATALSQFIAGKLDIISYPFAVLDNDQATQLKSAMKPDQYTEYQYFNTPMAIGLKQGNNPVKALTDPKVRLAMQYAIDLASIEKEFFRRDISNGIKISGIWANGTAFNDPASWPADLLASYTTYDPAKAKALLAEAGYPDGFTFDCTIFAMLPTPLFQLVSEYLSAVDIKMNLVVGNTPPDMTSVGADPNNPASVFYNIWATSPSMLSYSVLKDGPNNYVHQNDPKLDTMMSDLLAAQTLADQTKLAKEIDQYYMSQHYLLYISGCEGYSNWFNNRVQGLHGQALTPNYYMGYMLARAWVTDGK